MEQACHEDQRARFQGLSAELDTLSRELDALSERSGALDALRADSTGNNADELSERIRRHTATSAASQSLIHIVPLISKCYGVTTPRVSEDLILKVEGCEALQHVKAVLAARQGSIPIGTQIVQQLNEVVMGLRSGVFPRLVDSDSLTAGGDVFQSFLSATCTGMSSLTDCFYSLISHAAVGESHQLQGLTPDVFGCVEGWVEALVALSSMVVDASKEAPNVLRSGVVLTKVWKEIARVLQATPADSRDALAQCAGTAFSMAWGEFQKSIRELATSGKEKHSLNEKLCRFWMQNCGKLINEVPSCLAAAGSQVWGTAHVLYAAVSVAPTLCSQPGLSMPLEQRQLLLSTLSQHLLPRVQVCAEQALSHLSQASIHQHLQGLASCLSNPNDEQGTLLEQLVPEHVRPAAVAVGGLYLLAVTLAHSQQWPALHVASTTLQSFSNLCESLRCISSVPGASQVDPTWPSQVAPHLTTYLLSLAGVPEENSHFVDSWAAFTKICECSEYVPHAVAACMVSTLCTAQGTPQHAAALSKTFWCAAQRRATCMLESQSCGMFAQHLMDAVAACRCSLVAAEADESGSAIQNLQQLFIPHSQASSSLLFNPVNCIAGSALFLATTSTISQSSESEVRVLEDSEVQRLAETVCDVLQWQLDRMGKLDAASEAVLQGNVLGLLCLLVTLVGGWSWVSQRSATALACCRSVPLSICYAAAQLCHDKQPAAVEVLHATVLLLLVAVCEVQHENDEALQLLLSTVQQSLASPDKLLLADAHGLHARALAALVSLRSSPGIIHVDMSSSSAAELSVTQCWESVFMQALDASDGRALASMLPWFAEYCTKCERSDYTDSVPKRLVGMKRDRAHGNEGSVFLALLERAQQAHKAHTSPDNCAAMKNQSCNSIESSKTVQYTCLALAETLALWSRDASSVRKGATEGTLWQQVAAAVKCEVAPELYSGMQNARHSVDSGKENFGGDAANRGTSRKQDWSDAATRDAALRDTVCLLRAVQQGEQACNPMKAKGLLSVCSQLQALISSEGAVM